MLRRTTEGHYQMSTTRKTKFTRLVAGAALVAGVVGGIGSPASADKPVEFSESGTFPDINPCTGEPMMVTFNVNVRVHEHGERFVVRSSATGTTDDGYVMDHGGGTQVFNGNNFRSVFTDNWYHEDGSRFQARGVVVVSGEEPPGEVLVDKFTLRCLGG